MLLRTVRGWCLLSARAVALVVLGTLCARAAEPWPPLPDEPAAEIPSEMPAGDSSVDFWLSSDPGSTLPTVNLTAGEDAIQIQHYGSLWGNIYYASSRTNPNSFTLWVFSEQDQGESALDIDIQRTRLGGRLVENALSRHARAKLIRHCSPPAGREKPSRWSGWSATIFESATLFYASPYKKPHT